VQDGGVVLTGATSEQIVVRVPADLLQAVRARAAEEERTVSGTIRYALRLYLTGTE
jgi:hypothetical protein